MTIASESANLDQSDGRKINSHLKIYTKMEYISSTAFTIHLKRITVFADGDVLLTKLSFITI